MIDAIVTDIDSPVFTGARWTNPDLELYARNGRFEVYCVSKEEFLELCRERNHEVCLKMLQSHSCEFFPDG